jgi:hypothetical protein
MQAMLKALADYLRLLQDSASREPLGSATLLFTLRARPLASLGAIITILALALTLSYNRFYSILADSQSTMTRPRRRWLLGHQTSQSNQLPPIG